MSVFGCLQLHGTLRSHHPIMVRAGAARREIRQAKRAIARAESGKKKGKRIAKADVPRRTAKRGATGLRAPPLPEKQAAAKKRPEAEPEPVDEMEPRFTDAEKKLRALEKKLRAVKAIRALVARGVETDAQQQSKLRSEKALLAQLESIRAEAARGAAAAAAAEEEEPPDAPGATGDDEDMSGLSKLEQRRRLKKRKHLDKVRARQESLLQREARDSEARAARIALAAAPAAKRGRS
ncbi:hypothetical protein EMIHUDRAFT_235803 [Emiliania huxleyi CCMP1516]|uniref:Ribosome biogenesis protein NOP53 n=4 Tax=Emiliania huxleyi TaxID=2903 RepID=A0A0D3JVC1_EMIH1|nr:hypothetical protein EMIHUDRAFT_235803 [Emiliania huxleyi CCMP1516]EOD27456.1 hypothetical protein EMIHUDRAFT_235803 [Emiliania huxleyi CCMP1516]|eukprot:XP_005779885.1 hypothetical protein EMIHUDRAFT_235803 [Emiliania huxleyi CCMP1516]